MILSEIAAWLDSAIPLPLQESYDNCGLLVGDKTSNIAGALISLDVNNEVIDEAIKKNCNLVVSHHPLIFSGIKSFTGSNDTERVVIRAIKENIAIYALHTNLDNHLEGVNRMLCSKLGISDPVILRPISGNLRKLVTFCPHSHAEQVRSALFSAGAGHIGNYDSCSFGTPGEGTFKALQNAKPFVGKKWQLHTEPELRIETIFPAFKEKEIVSSLILAHPYEEVAFDIYPLANSHALAGSGMVGNLKEATEAGEFLHRVKSSLAIGCIKHTATGNKKISRVAVCGGSGSFLIKDAIACGADIYLTGDIKYHDYFLPENKMILADIGHYESEQFTKELIYDLLNEKFTNFALFISESVTNPVNYL